MQRTTQPSRATDTSSTTRHVSSASLHAKANAPSALAAAQSPSQSHGKSTITSSSLATQPRRALQPLDNLQRRPQPPSLPASVSKAPFAYVSRFSRPQTTTASATASVTGLKRKQRHAADIATKDQVDEEEGEEAADPLALQQRENVAWLDMLVALLERKYEAYAPPVCVDHVERAKLLDGYWPSKASFIQKSTATEPASSSKRSRLSLPTPPATTSTSTNETADDKEEKRTQALRRHAQQIHDTSVSSTSCCGCKTGCLKMYCVCFSTRGYCHDGCSCDNCKNARASADLRLEAMTTYLLNDPRAFSHAAATASSSVGTSHGFFQLLPQKASTVVMRGCRCKKSKCLKKYCECFQNGLGCGPHCRCVDCANDASAAAREMRAKNSSDGSATVDGNSKMPAVASAVVAVSGGGAFHAIKVAVTKKPRRNYVVKSVRLRL